MELEQWRETKRSWGKFRQIGSEKVLVEMASLDTMKDHLPVLEVKYRVKQDIGHHLAHGGRRDLRSRGTP